MNELRVNKTSRRRHFELEQCRAVMTVMGCAIVHQRQHKCRVTWPTLMYRGMTLLYRVGVPGTSHD